MALARTVAAQERELDPRERIFISQYVLTMNASEAAARAGYTSPTVLGCRKLQDPVVRRHIEKALHAMAMSPGEVLARLSAQAGASVGDIADIDESGYLRLNFKKARDTGKLHCIKKIKFNAQGLPEVELHDSQAALVALAKCFAMFTENVRHIGADGGAVQVQVMRDSVNAMLGDPSALARALALAQQLETIQNTPTPLPVPAPIPAPTDGAEGAQGA